MTEGGGLEVLVVDLEAHLQELKKPEPGAKATSGRIDELEARIDALVSSESLSYWATTRQIDEAKQNLVQRGVDVGLVDLSAIVDRKEAELIEARNNVKVSRRVSLDSTDVAMGIVAGLIGGAVDILVAATPRTSGVTTKLRSFAIDSDNWLAGVAHVPYDWHPRASGPLSPIYHRVQSPGHDPLLGLIAGTTDILRGTFTGFGPSGSPEILDAFGQQFDGGWPAALGLQVLHLLSDLPTSCGLPLPGWTALAQLPTSDDQSRHWAQLMYARGYDSWHLLSMAAGPAAVELTCRTYWGLRSQLDESFEGSVGTGPLIAESRYLAISSIGHAVAAAVDLAHFAATGSNPLTLNYAQWFMVAKRAADNVRNVAEGDGFTERLIEAGDDWGQQSGGDS